MNNQPSIRNLTLRYLFSLIGIFPWAVAYALLSEGQQLKYSWFLLAGSVITGLLFYYLLPRVLKRKPSISQRQQSGLPREILLNLSKACQIQNARAFLNLSLREAGPYLSHGYMLPLTVRITRRFLYPTTLSYLSWIIKNNV